MARHPLGFLICLLVPAFIAVALPGPAEEPTHHWHVNANGAEGMLDLSIESGARLSGTLLGSPVTGWLVGHRLVLLREGSKGQESWEGWLATPENVLGSQQPILAGTFLRPGEDGPLPWFGTSRPQTAKNVVPVLVPPSTGTLQGEDLTDNPPKAASAPQPVLPLPSTEPEAQTPAATPAPTPSEPASAPAPSYIPSGKPSLAGPWITPDGPLTIRQKGSSLVFVLPDREVSGRLTGGENLIGGFAPGCCKGHLEQAFSVIVWDNGIRWHKQ